MTSYWRAAASIGSCTNSNLRAGAKVQSVLMLVAAHVLVWYMRFVMFTGRVNVVGKEHLDGLAAANEQHQTPFIIATWHGRLALTPFIDCGRAIHAMVSLHKDGELVARVIEAQGNHTVRGSSNRGADDPKGKKDRGGAKALAAAVKVLKKGGIVAVTPDGPKGPNQQAKDGFLLLAEKTNAPVLPMMVSASCAKWFNSWDRFMLPLPFSRLEFHFAAPIAADTHDREKTRNLIENQLNLLVRNADEASGQSPHLA